MLILKIFGATNEQLACIFSKVDFFHFRFVVLTCGRLMSEEKAVVLTQVAIYSIQSIYFQREQNP